jgi:hypothetical protein
VGVLSPSPSETDSEDVVFRAASFLHLCITQDLNSSLGKSCKDLKSGLLNSHKGVPVYVQEKALALQLRLPTQHPPILRMQPQV